MVFSSLVFLFIFLPTVLTLYYLLPIKFKNIILLVSSLFFYAWGEPIYVFLMIFSIVINYSFGFMVSQNNKKRKFNLVIAVVSNIAILSYFKYLAFFADTIFMIFGHKFNVPKLALPIGISFFTFHAMSYVIDVYRNDVLPQKNLFKLALYITLFPQLVAGPILRYHQVFDQFTNRTHSLEKFAQGINRFVIGLSKKVLIANQLGIVADKIFALNFDQMSISSSWIGIIAYTLQIYFDFSAYSDMAIGLGKMFGFEFPENFNYPYVSQSVSEFWRRWHISLSTWFRDYVYIPLGGNRTSKFKIYRNLFVVWLLTGFWHGANWTFIAWGLYFGIMIMLERMFLGKWLEKIPRILRHVYLLIIVMIGWVFFKADNFSYSINFLKTIVGLGQNKTFVNSESLELMKYYGYVFVLGVIFAVPILNSTREFLKKKGNILDNTYFKIAQSFCLIILCFLVTEQLVVSSYNPFLYFRF